MKRLLPHGKINKQEIEMVDEAKLYGLSDRTG